MFKMNITLPETTYEVDEEGYLCDSTIWNEGFVILFAEQNNIVLTDKHWSVVYFLREYYEEYQIQPAEIFLIKNMRAKWKMKKNIDAENCLSSLFPYNKGLFGKISVMMRCAGLPKPTC